MLSIRHIGTRLSFTLSSVFQLATLPHLQLLSFTCYNVLWINSEGEVAYRKGSGEVDRLIWDKIVGETETAISLG